MLKDSFFFFSFFLSAESKIMKFEFLILIEQTNREKKGILPTLLIVKLDLRDTIASKFVSSLCYLNMTPKLYQQQLTKDLSVIFIVDFEEEKKGSKWKNNPFKNGFDIEIRSSDGFFFFIFLLSNL